LGWTLLSGQGTASIEVIIGYEAGSISVTTSTLCGTSQPEQLQATVLTIPGQPSPIFGPQEMCAGASGTYSVTPVQGVTYFWELGPGWIINEGQGTYAIEVTAGTAGGEIIVVPSTACGEGPSSSIMVSVNTVPGSAGTIVGDFSVCMNETGVVYTVPEIIGATEYFWTLPEGASGSVSGNSVEVDYPTGSVNGYITVSGVNECGSGVASGSWVTVNELPYEHVLTIPAGWSGISSYIDPTDDSVEDIFEPVEDQLVILNDGENHIYWPAMDINTLQTWSPVKGYFIETTQPTELTFYGCADGIKTVSLETGWNVIPVLSSDPVLTSGLFDPIGNKLIIVVEIAGPGTYWPAMGVNTLPYLSPGKAYQVEVTEPCSVTFP
jgi:hypothetical protein